MSPLHRQAHGIPLSLCLYHVCKSIYAELAGDQIHVLLPLLFAPFRNVLFSITELTVFWIFKTSNRFFRNFFQSIMHPPHGVASVCKSRILVRFCNQVNRSISICRSSSIPSATVDKFKLFASCMIVRTTARVSGSSSA